MKKISVKGRDVRLLSPSTFPHEVEQNLYKDAVAKLARRIEHRGPQIPVVRAPTLREAWALIFAANKQHQRPCYLAGSLQPFNRQLISLDPNGGLVAQAGPLATALLNGGTLVLSDLCAEDASLLELLPILAGCQAFDFAEFGVASVLHNDFRIVLALPFERQGQPVSPPSILEGFLEAPIDAVGNQESTRSFLKEHLKSDSKGLLEDIARLLERARESQRFLSAYQSRGYAEEMLALKGPVSEYLAATERWLGPDLAKAAEQEKLLKALSDLEVDQELADLASLVEDE